MPQSEPHFSWSVHKVQKEIYTTWTVLNKQQDERGADSNRKKRTRLTKVLRPSPSVINVVLACVYKQDRAAARQETDS